MIILDATTKTVQVLLGGAVTTNELPIVASYVDVTTTTYTPGSADSITIGASAVTALSAPAASAQRQLKYLSVYNADTVSAVVTVRYNNNGTTRILIKTTLTAGQSLVYTDGEGWAVQTASAGGGTWGSITGTLADQTDLQAALDAKVAATRSVISGAGLTGGGDLSADRTLVVGAGIGITVNADDVAVNQAALKLDDWAAPDDNTDLDASTSKHGLVVKATAPAAGLLSAVGIENGETAYTMKPLFDTTNPAALGTAGPGTALVAARRDHIHTLPKIDDLAAADDNTDLNASSSAHGLLPKLSSVVTQFLNGQGGWTTPVGGTPTEETTTSTGTVDNFDLDARITFLRCNNASALVLTGFTTVGGAPSDGDTVIIFNVGSSTVKVTNQDTNSTDANRIITPSTAGQIIGANGHMVGVYDGTTDRWRISCVDPGAPISWTPTDTSGAALSFTNVAATYQQLGNNVYIRFILRYPSTVDATPSKIGSFPFTHSGEIGYAMGLTACATPMYVWGAGATTDAFPIKQAGGTSLTNAELTLAFVNGSGNITIA